MASTHATHAPSLDEETDTDGYIPALPTAVLWDPLAIAAYVMCPVM